MTSPFMQESSAKATWDFGSVFVALEKPIPMNSNKILSSEGSITSLNTSLNLAQPQDHDKLPEERSSLDIRTALGDFGDALSYLGYSVSVTGPINNVGNSIPNSQKLDGLTTLEPVLEKHSTPLSPIQTPIIENSFISEDPETSKAVARRAENGRRTVLKSYLGCPAEGLTPNEINRKWLIPRTPNGPLPGPMIFTVPDRAKKEASMMIFAEKKVQVILELHKRFPKELKDISNIAGNSMASDPNGIHCFVDISNILIGFHDSFKWNRKINKHARIPRQTLSFHNLSLILERGRPVAKRFLAGSDDIDCTREARFLGYTTHILQRVEKPDSIPSSGIRKGRRSGLASSDTDSGAGTPGRVRRAEQAVDEVLHLGMLQSLLDSDKPSTMVLASGDAAKAEFSDGFLKQVERALLKGWKVEVVAFQATTGYAYRDPQWISRWRKSFKFIPLDDFVELIHVPS